MRLSIRIEILQFFTNLTNIQIAQGRVPPPPLAGDISVFLDDTTCPYDSFLKKY